MRIPLALAWLLLGMALFTSGLLRQFHDLTPTSPFLNPAIGSLLFACVVFLFLVAIRERQIGAAYGAGVRLGSLTPFLLMLLVEKWVSATLYLPVFSALAPTDIDAAAADAGFRALCGLGLLAIVAVTSTFSKPARSFLRRRIQPARILPGLALAAASAGAAWVLLEAPTLLLGAQARILPPTASPLGLVVVGQSVLAFAEELWFRGLLAGEVFRLAPRLGLRSLVGRRWLAIGTTALLFGFEHYTLAGGFDEGLRQLVFALALGALFGMLVFLTSNLWLAAALHAWINLLILGALPRVGYGPSGTTLPPGASISLALIAAFVAAFVAERRRYARTASSQSS